MALSLAQLREKAALTPAPAAGQGLQLDSNGRIPASLLPYLPGYEAGYDQITAGVTVASTTEATPTSVVGGSARPYENVPYWFQFFSPNVTDSTAANSAVVALLMMDAVSVGRMGSVNSTTVTTQIVIPFNCFFRYTPTAGLHTFGVSAFCVATTGTPFIQAGAGGINTAVPAFLRVTRA